MGDNPLLRGRVVRAHGNNLIVHADDRMFQCVLRGKFKLEKGTQRMPVCVGDYVLINTLDNENGAIEEVLPRESKLSRRAVSNVPLEQVMVANLDQMVAVFATETPRLNLRMLDRLLVSAEKERLESAVCINKCDLVNIENLEEIRTLYNRIGYRVVLTSAISRIGLVQFCDVLKDKTSVLTGPSGVGKSTLLNEIQPRLQLRTLETSTKTRKGQHATTFVQLIPLSFGGYVVDTPGLRQLSLWDISRRELDGFFPEMRGLIDQCRFSDCYHVKEPDCAVRKAVEDGQIDERRYDSYLRIFESL